MSDLWHYADLLPLVATDLEGCNEADKLAELERAARELCQRSRVWRTILHLNYEKGEQAKAIDEATGYARVEYVNKAYRNGARMCRVPRVTIGVDGSQFVDIGRPAELECTIAVHLSLAPSRLGVIPAWLMNEFGDIMAAGALMRIKRHFNKSYTDREGSAFAEREWRQGISMAAVAGAERTSSVVDDGSVTPQASKWTVGAGSILRSYVGDNPTISDLTKAVRTLIEDLINRGVI